MPLQRLTARYVETARAPNARVEIRDAVVKGLELRVTPRGAKTWAVHYTRRSDGKRRRVTLGRYPGMTLDDARERALEEIIRVGRGGDPADGVRERKEALTFDDLASEWIEEHGKANVKRRALADDRSMLRRHILPAIGLMKADEVTKRDVVKMLNAVKRAPDARFKQASTAQSDGRRKRFGNPTVLSRDRALSHRPNRVFELVRSIYSWGMRQDLIKSNPVAGVERPVKKERPRERDLTDDEIRAFWRGLEKASMSEEVRLAMRISLATAQRIGEVTSIAKRELDFKSVIPVWNIPSRHTKNDRPHRVPLSPLAKELIETAMNLAPDNPWLFPSPSGNGAMGEHAATRAMGRARATLGIEDIRVHDLRKTAATGMAKLGISPHTISLVLNHASARTGTVTLEHYINQYSYDGEKREALLAWGEQLQKIIR